MKQGFADFTQRVKVPPAATVADTLTRFTAASFLFALIVSWKLWFSERPLVRPYPMLPIPALPHSVELALLCAIMAACAALIVLPRFRHLNFIPAAAFLFWSLQDELRWQPFLYMYFFIFIVCGFLPKRPVTEDLDPLRYMVASIYVWAGLHKLNMVFIYLVFPWFVSKWIDWLPLTSLIGTFVPLIEVGIGLCLFVPRFRRQGIMIAATMLTVVLMSLMRHGWGMIVWPWNVTIFACAFLLFWDEKRSLLDKTALKNKLSVAAIVMYSALPALGLFGILGDGLAYRLYCGCSPSSAIHFSPKEDLSFLPENLRQLDADGLDGTALMHSIFRIAATSAIGYDNMYRANLQGICPSLKYPEEATLTILRYPHIWSIRQVSVTTPLCKAPTP